MSFCEQQTPFLLMELIKKLFCEQQTPFLLMGRNICLGYLHHFAFGQSILPEGDFTEGAELFLGHVLEWDLEVYVREKAGLTHERERYSVSVREKACLTHERDGFGAGFVVKISKTALVASANNFCLMCWEIALGLLLLGLLLLCLLLLGSSIGFQGGECLGLGILLLLVQIFFQILQIG